MQPTLETLPVALGLLFLAGTTGVFLVKDVYQKVGEIPALKERIKTLEQHADNSQKMAESVVRLEERVKDLIAKVEMLTSALLKDHVPNG